MVILLRIQNLMEVVMQAPLPLVNLMVLTTMGTDMVHTGRKLLNHLQRLVDVHPLLVPPNSHYMPQLLLTNLN